MDNSLLDNLSELKFYCPQDRSCGGDVSQAFITGCNFVAALCECGETEKAKAAFEWVEELAEQSEAWAREYDPRAIRHNNFVQGHHTPRQQYNMERTEQTEQL